MGSSAIILYNKKGQILLQLRSAYKKRFANHWGLFGGHIDKGETPEETLIREIKEELGYEVRGATKFKVSPPEDDPLHIYYELYDESQALFPDISECQEARWCTPDEIKTMDPFIKTDKEDLLEFCDFIFGGKEVG